MYSSLGYLHNYMSACKTYSPFVEVHTSNAISVDASESIKLTMILFFLGLTVKSLSCRWREGGDGGRMSEDGRVSENGGGVDE